MWSHQGGILGGIKTVMNTVIPLRRASGPANQAHMNIKCLSRQVIFAKGASYAIRELSRSSYDVIGLDWTVPVEDARYEKRLSVWTNWGKERWFV